MSYIGKEPSYGVFEKQILTGDGSTLQFTLDHPVAGAGSILVSLGGVIQEPQSAYDINYISGSPKILKSVIEIAINKKINYHLLTSKHYGFLSSVKNKDYIFFNIFGRTEVS